MFSKTQERIDILYAAQTALTKRINQLEINEGTQLKRLTRLDDRDIHNGITVRQTRDEIADLRADLQRLMDYIGVEFVDLPAERVVADPYADLVRDLDA